MRFRDVSFVDRSGMKRLFEPSWRIGHALEADLVQWLRTTGWTSQEQSAAYDTDDPIPRP